MVRRTKIIATLGPATSNIDIIRRIVQAGVNVVRINMSHGLLEEKTVLIQHTRMVAQELKKEVGILIDLQGPKVRIAKFKDDPIQLKRGDKFTLDADLDVNAGTQQQVGIDYKDLPKDVNQEDTLLVDDGRIVLEVVEIDGKKIICKVKVGGELSNNKGINRRGGGLSAQSLTKKDKQDIIFAAEQQADYVALSFPRSAKDIEKCRKLLQQAGSKAGVIAKIERIEAVAALNEIIEASDAVMVARGDLGVEVGFAELPAIQKRIINQAMNLDKAVITATQMMESMISSPIPTRAEVSDIANAVVEGTDAVMLSAESATGKYPVQVVEAMAQVCLAAERQKVTSKEVDEFKLQFDRVDQTVAKSAMYVASHLEVKGIVALTESGSTTLWMSRMESNIPIYGVSRNASARGKMTLYKGVYPINIDIMQYKRWEIIREVLTALRDKGIVRAGERIIVTRGDIAGVEGYTNTMKVVTVEPND